MVLLTAAATANAAGRYLEVSYPSGTKHEYRVIVVNGVGLRSQPSSPVSIP